MDSQSKGEPSVVYAALRPCTHRLNMMQKREFKFLDCLAEREDGAHKK